MTPTDPTRVESHFAFGENWADFAKGIDEAAIAEAESGLLRLVDRNDIAGASFLDIGCGSGLHALAAIRLGADRVVALDIDPDAVATATSVLARHAAGRPWTVRGQSVLETGPDMGPFGVVYSWGVLHHTGNLTLAIRNATALVAPRGLFVCALYRRTLLDPLWVMEKRWYASASPRAQARMQALYRGALRLGLLAAGRSYRAHELGYKSRRGMSLNHDIHDWLGGYPYQSISSEEVGQLLTSLGFEHVRSFTRKTALGLLGSGCDEYVFRRVTDAP
ncbi:MAG: class I SAM-dependent methyltransferase [Methyloceanibacter sp.]